MFAYLGTYAAPGSLGVYRVPFAPASGALGALELLCSAPDAKYAALAGNALFSPVRRGGRAGLLAADRDTGAVLDELLLEEVPACYVAAHDGRVYTANYHEGSVLSYDWGGQRLTPVRRLTIAPKAGCHQVLFHGSTLLVPCLELDEVRLFDLDRDWAPLGTVRLPPGSGPRHGVFRGNCLFLVSERSSQLFTIRAGTWAVEHTAPLPSAGDAAAVRLSPDERFLYTSTRGANLLSVFRVDGACPELIQQTSCGGDHPRDFTLSPDGRHLLVVNRTTGGLVSFALDPETGLIGAVHGRAACAEGVSVCLGD